MVGPEPAVRRPMDDCLVQTLTAFGLIGVYVVLIGVSTFLEKPVLRGLDPLQLNALVGLGIFLVGVVAVFVLDRRVPPVGPLGAGLAVGLMIGLGSIAYFVGLTRLPVSVAATVGDTYIVVTVLLSFLFLHDTITLPKVAGITCCIAGVLLLAYHA